MLDYRSTKGEAVLNIGLPGLLLIELLFAVVCGYIARRKGRSTAAWAVLGFLFSLIALVITILLPKSRPSRQAGVA